MLHILLAVAPVHAQRVQFHQLACVVFVDLALGVLGVVQVLQHCRAFQRGHHQVGELAGGIGADRVFHVVGRHPLHPGLVGIHAEMIEPEPHQLLAQLIRRVHRAQQLRLPRLHQHLTTARLPLLAQGNLLIAIGHGLQANLVGFVLGQQIHQRGMQRVEALQLRAYRRGQRSVVAGLQQQRTKALGAQPCQLGRAAGINTIGGPLQPAHLRWCQRRLRSRASERVQAADQQRQHPPSSRVLRARDARVHPHGLASLLEHAAPPSQRLATQYG